MTVRRVNLTNDPAPLTAMYAAAMPGMVWPYPITAIDQATMTQLLAQGGWVSLSGSTRRMCILTPAHVYKDADGTLVEKNAEELWSWFWATGLSLSQLGAATKEILIAWWTDMRNRGVALGWSKTPEPMEARVEVFMQSLKLRGMTTETRIIRGVSWRIVKMNPTAALAVLTGWNP